MKGLGKRITSEYAKEYANTGSYFLLKMYSDPKLYIPTKMVKGKKTPCLDDGCRWYVYFYFRDPETGKMGRSPFKFYKNINQENTVAGRRKAGNAWVKVIRQLLAGGFNPYDRDALDLEETDIRPTIAQAFTRALENKKNALKPNTYLGYWDYLNPFLAWCKSKGIAELSIDRLTDRHIISYLNYLGREKPEGRGLKPTSVSNAKGNLSAIMGKMKADRVVEVNFIKDLTVKKNKPLKNAPFTVGEIKKIRDYTLKNDLLLYNFIRFIFYSFMRNAEIVRIQKKHIDMANRTIAIPTKTDKLAYIFMIDPMYKYLEGLQLENHGPNAFIFTPEGKPGSWEATEKSKVGFLAKRFKAVRKHFDIEMNKTTYSFRHNAALDLFHSFLGDGMTENEAINKLMKITRHKSEQALRNYLREVGGILPEDWSGAYTVSF